MNLASMDIDTTQVLTTDLAHGGYPYYTSNLGSTNPDANTGYAGALTYDADGFPQSPDGGTTAAIPSNWRPGNANADQQLVFRIGNGNSNEVTGQKVLPGGAGAAGDYTLMWTGTGTVTAIGSSVASITPLSDVTGGGKTWHRATVHINSWVGRVGIAIQASSAADPVRDLRFILPGYLHANGYSVTRIVPTDTAAVLSKFKRLRWMVPQVTNGDDTGGNATTGNANRTKLTSVSQAVYKKGISYELICAISNELGIDPWICLPYQVDDQYITDQATYFKNNLSPGLNLGVEYGNEFFNYNSPFYYARNWAAARGAELFTGGQVQDWVAKRNADIWYLYSQVYGSEMSTRVTKILAAQQDVSMGYANLVYDSLTNVTKAPVVNPHGMAPDVVAVGGYLGETLLCALVAYVGAGNPVPDAAAVNTTYLLGSYMTKLQGEMVAAKTWADARNLRVYVYEGGTHLTFATCGSASSNPTAIALQKAIHRDPTMRQVMSVMLTTAFNAGVSDYCFFEAFGAYGEYCWGALESSNQAVSTSPRMLGLLDVVNTLNARGKPSMRIFFR